MTIKEFAKLCDCNPQTLRYYDSIDLLKPVNVDSWTGYRYYDEEQALAFVKIRNLQKGGFSIEEIKELLTQDDIAVAMAFEAKIAEAEAHLREIKAIRASYLTDMNNMKEKIYAIRDRILRDIRKYDATAEFGIDRAQYEAIISSIEACLNEAAASVPTPADIAAMMPDPADIADAVAGAASGEPVPAPAAPAEPHDFRLDPAYTVVYEKHGWANVKDFLAEFEQLDPGHYCLDFAVTADKYDNTIAFSNTILGILLAKNEGKSKSFGCYVEQTPDGQNHMKLYKKVGE